jgi:hypothetical protein
MPSTPPSSPSNSRDAARHLERSNRIMGSPENRRIPTDPSVTPSLNQNSTRGPPSDFITQLSSIPLQHHQNLHNNPQGSASTSTLAPPPIIAPASSSHRQTLTSAQLAAAYAALPPLNPHHHDAPSSHRQTLTSAQLTAAYTALPPLIPLNSRLRSIPLAVSSLTVFFKDTFTD